MLPHSVAENEEKIIFLFFNTILLLSLKQVFLVRTMKIDILKIVFPFLSKIFTFELRKIHSSVNGAKQRWNGLKCLSSLTLPDVSLKQREEILLNNHLFKN